MIKRILVGASAVAALGFLAAPTASAADGQVFRNLGECQNQANADVAAGGGSHNLYAWCSETHVVGPPTFGCDNPLSNGGCIGDFWVEHTRPV